MTASCHRLVCVVSALCLGACGSYPCTLYEETPTLVSAATFRASTTALPLPVASDDLFFTRAYSPCVEARGCTGALGPCPNGASSCLAVGTVDFSLNFLPPDSTGSFSLDDVSALLCNLTGDAASCTPAHGSIVVGSVDLSCASNATTDCKWLDATLTVDSIQGGASLAGTITVTDADTATSATCGGGSAGHSPPGLD